MVSLDRMRTQSLSAIKLLQHDEQTAPDQSLRNDLLALVLPLLVLVAQGARIVVTGTLQYIADPTNPKHRAGDLARYVNMALPNGDYKLAHEPPYLYRILIPLLVHGLYILGLPFQTGFFSITSLALAISTVAIYFLVRGCNLSRFEAVCATLAYLTIHWAVAYNFGDYFLIDASAQAFIACILLLIQRRHFTSAIIVSTIGIICNERIFLAVAVGVIQLILPYIRPAGRTVGLLLRARVGQVYHNAPRIVWLQLVAFLVFPILAFWAVHTVQHPYYNTQLLVEMREYIPTHFRYGSSSLYVDYNGGTLYTFGSLYLPALLALVLGLWPRTGFSLWSYVAAFLIIVFSFTLSGDLQRLTVVGWPFIIMLAAVTLHSIATALRIAVAWLWGIILLGGTLFQLSLTLQVVPGPLQSFITKDSFHILIWTTAVFMALAVLAYFRAPEAIAATALPMTLLNHQAPSAAASDAGNEETFDDLRTTKRVAVRPTTPYAVPTDPDGLFWMQMRGGLVALGAHNRWKAAERLRMVEETILTPLTEQARQRALAAPSAERPTLSLQAPQNDFEALWQAYRATIAAYQAVRQQLALPQSPLGEIERDTLAMLNTTKRRIGDAMSSIISWRTLSIVLPAYNEEAVISETIWDCLRLTEHYCPNVEVIVVNDGSRDSTGAIIDSWAAGDARVRPVHLIPNQGYGSALMAGFTAAEGEWMFFMDSDGQFDIRQLHEFVELGDPQPQTAILGYRARRSDPFVRKLNAWGWKRLTGVVLGLHGVRDIDCAFKLLPADAVRACHIQTRGAMINTEMLIKFQRMHVPLVQVPVNHFPRTHGKATGANLSVIARAFRELLQLRLRLKDWTPTPPAARNQ